MNDTGRSETMDNRDEWGTDPSVQMMRGVFRELEEAQEKLLEALSVSPFDSRLRKARDSARNLFERTWPLYLRKDNAEARKNTAWLYTHCLARALGREGITVAGNSLPENEFFMDLVKEAEL